MKQLFTLLFALCALTTQAQTDPDQMVVKLKTGETVTYSLDNVEEVAFGSSRPAVVAYEVTRPTEFTGNYVKKVMADGKQVAELDYEYINTVGKQRWVLYPIGADGKADLTKGVSLDDGNAVVWNVEANTVTYQSDATPLDKVWVVNGEIVTTEQQGAMATTLVDDLLDDKRPGSPKKYATVKIGTQYWMAENLAAKHLADGTPITNYATAQATEWGAATAPAWHVYSDNADMENFYGVIYNGYAFMNGTALAPTGWAVPTIDQWAALKTYVGNYSTRFRTNSSLWGTAAGSNVSGFSGLPGGQFVYSGDPTDRDESISTYFWSSTVTRDLLTRADAVETVALTSRGFTARQGGLLHAATFGHYVRCIRQ